MKYILLSILLLVNTLSISGKYVKKFEISSTVRIHELLGEDKYDIDSVVIMGEMRPMDFYTLRNMSTKGNLRGINMYNACVYNDTIPANAFYGINEYNDPAESDVADKSCKLEYITLPIYLEALMGQSFSQSKLRSISIPRGIRYIASDAFDGCDSLKMVSIKEPYPAQTDGRSPFTNCKSINAYNVPIGSKSKYHQNTSWTDINEDKIVESPSLFVTKDIVLSGDDLAQYISVDGDEADSLHISGYMTQADCKVLSQSYNKSFFSGIDLSGCTVECDTLPTFFLRIGYLSLKTRPELAAKLSPLMYVNLPEGIKRLGWDCIVSTYLQRIDLPSSLETLSKEAFYCNKYIRSPLIIPEGVKRIDEYCFVCCNYVPSVYIPSTVEWLGKESLGFRENKSYDIYIDRMTPPDSEHNESGNLMSFGPFESNESYPGWTLYIPVGAKQNYLNSIYFKDFWRIVETPELTGGATAIDGVESGVTERDNGYADGVYTLDGKRIADTMTDGMAKGLYVVKRGASISKVAVR